MNRILISCWILVCMLLCSCGGQSHEDEMFLGNIKQGANLEECIASGLVKNSSRPNEYELSSENFNGCTFKRTEVNFDANHIINKVELTYYYTFFHTNMMAPEEDLSSQYFNTMMQYCCLHYGNMTSENMDVTDNLGKIKGCVKKWSTGSLNVRLESYVRRCFIEQNVQFGDLDSKVYDGNYVKFIVTNK